MVIDDFQVNRSDYQRSGSNTNREVKQSHRQSHRQSKRAFSGPSGASKEGDYRLLSQAPDVPEYFQDQSKNSFNSLFKGNKNSQSNLGQKSFPNLTYVTAKYFNPEKGQFIDKNNDLGQHSQMYSQPRPMQTSDFLKNEGLISPIPASGQYATRRSDNRLGNFWNQNTSHINLQNQSTRVTNPNGCDSNYRSYEDITTQAHHQMSSQNIKTKHKFEEKSQSRSPTKSNNWFDGLSESQKKEAFNLYKETQLKSIPQMIMTSTPENRTNRDDFRVSQ